jgi:hypothetical protein
MNSNNQAVAIHHVRQDGRVADVLRRSFLSMDEYLLSPDGQRLLKTGRYPTLPSHITSGTALTPSHITIGTALTPCHICTGTLLAGATSAPGAVIGFSHVQGRFPSPLCRIALLASATRGVAAGASWG